MVVREEAENYGSISRNAPKMRQVDKQKFNKQQRKCVKKGIQRNREIWGIGREPLEGS